MLRVQRNLLTQLVEGKGQGTPPGQETPQLSWSTNSCDQERMGTDHSRHVHMQWAWVVQPWQISACEGIGREKAPDWSWGQVTERVRSSLPQKRHLRRVQWAELKWLPLNMAYRPTHWEEMNQFPFLLYSYQQGPILPSFTPPSLWNLARAWPGGGLSLHHGHTNAICWRVLRDNRDTSSQQTWEPVLESSGTLGESLQFWKPLFPNLWIEVTRPISIHRPFLPYYDRASISF